MAEVTVHQKRRAPAVHGNTKWTFFAQLKVGQQATVSTKHMTPEAARLLWKTIRQTASKKKFLGKGTFATNISADGIHVERLA